MPWENHRPPRHRHPFDHPVREVGADELTAAGDESPVTYPVVFQSPANYPEGLYKIINLRDHHQFHAGDSWLVMTTRRTGMLNDCVHFFGPLVGWFVGSVFGTEQLG